jgi:hypothetical protein
MAEENPILRNILQQTPTSESDPQESPSLGSLSQQVSTLGSLAQSAQQKQLNTARWILIGVGILTVLVNLAFFALIESQVDDLIKQQVNSLHQQGLQEDPVLLAKYRTRVIQIAQLLQGGAAAIGVVFIILGLMVKKYPVPSTIIGLVLYIGGNALFGYMDPETLAKGWLIKIIVVVVLIKSIKAAIAYKRAQTAAETTTLLVPV